MIRDYKHGGLIWRYMYNKNDLLMCHCNASAKWLVVTSLITILNAFVVLITCPQKTACVNFSLKMF